MFVMHSPFPHFTAIAIACSYVLIVQYSCNVHCWTTLFKAISTRFLLSWNICKNNSTWCSVSTFLIPMLGVMTVSLLTHSHHTFSPSFTAFFPLSVTTFCTLSSRIPSSNFSDCGCNDCLTFTPFFPHITAMCSSNNAAINNKSKVRCCTTSYSKLFLHVSCCHGTFAKTTQHGVWCLSFLLPISGGYDHLTSS